MANSFAANATRRELESVFIDVDQLQQTKGQLLPGRPECIGTLRSEKKAEKEEKDKDYRIVERSYGSFVRAIEFAFRR
jgi:hypothetical protein